MIAALPMYDWPEVRAATDALWSALREALSAAGFAAPEALTRSHDPWPLWQSPDLLFGQTCGLPFAARLSGEVALIGAPDNGLEGCPPGFYRSEIVVRADDPAGSVEALRGRRFALNGWESWSGRGAFARDHRAPEAWFGAVEVTGAHRASIRAVAEGRADAAAIDAASWRLALAHEPATARLRVLAATRPAPALPFIAAGRFADRAEAIFAAATAGIAALAPADRDALGVYGLVGRAAADYAPLAAFWPAEAGH